MKAVVVREAGQPMKVQDHPVRDVGPDEIRIRVHACGVCHSDKFIAEALWPGLELPRVPGHEVAGVIDEVGERVTHLKLGDRVGLGWHGGHDGTCTSCLAGRFIHCADAKVTGISFDGGYAEYVVAPAVAAAPMPDGMSFTDAAPLLCAGVTTFNALRHAGARPGDLVAVQGLGGLGHLGVQYAKAMGFEVAAVSRGAGKERFARELGADHYVDTEAGEAGSTLAELGGARAILATAPHAPSISALVPGLAAEGCLMIVGAPFEPLTISAIDLISGSRRVQGWASGTASDSADAMAFAQTHGVKAMTELFALEDAAAAYGRMMDGSVRFRSVLQLG